MIEATLEQQIDSLLPEVGEYRADLVNLFAASRSSLDFGFLGVRKLMEDIIGCVMQEEGLNGDRDLMKNIVILGGRADGPDPDERKLADRRRRHSQEPTLPPILPSLLYSSMHTLRIYGNTAAHPRRPGGMEPRDDVLTPRDLSSAINLTLRLLEWYLQEYPHGPQMETIYSDDGLSRSGRGPVLHNLPAISTEFVGREEDLATCRAALLRPHVRLVTLLGMGGVGKTRMALQIAHDLREEFVDGIWWIRLEETRSADALIERIAQVLGVHLHSPETGRDQLFAFLQKRVLLLVLDNIEQIADAADLIAGLLEAAPGVRCLATTRRALHLQSEHIVEVDPLPQDEAVSLFYLRAWAKESQFALTDGNRQAVEALCRYVNFLPIGIELAAAKMRTMTPREMLDELHQDKSLLESDAADLPDRQRGLDRLIEWSYVLLEPPLQILFAHLAVFTGGFTVAAAREVVLADGVRPGIAALMDNSLLISEIHAASQSTRFSMLPLLREYALDRLDGSPETAHHVRRRHSGYFLTYAQERIVPVRTAEADALAEAEVENLNAALHWCEHNDVLRGLRAGTAMWHFWWRRGYARMGMERVRALMDKTDTALPEWAEAAAVAGHLARHVGEFSLAQTLYDQSLESFRHLDDASGAARVLRHIGVLAWHQGAEEAQSYFTAALLKSRECGDPLEIAKSHYELGNLARHRGNSAEAEQNLQQSLLIFQETKDLSGIGTAHLALGNVMVGLQRQREARAHYAESLALFAQMGDKGRLTLVFERIAAFAHLHRRFRPATMLIGAAEKLREEIGSRLPAPDRQEYYAQLIADLKNSVGQDYVAELAKGRLMILDEAVRLAKEETMPLHQE